VVGSPRRSHSSADDSISLGFIKSPEHMKLVEESTRLAGVHVSPLKPHAVRDGNLITGQQQYSGAAAARRVVEALGV